MKTKSRAEELAEEYATPEMDLWTPIQRETVKLERLAFIAGFRAAIEEAKRIEEEIAQDKTRNYYEVKGASAVLLRLQALLEPKEET